MASIIIMKKINPNLEKLLILLNDRKYHDGTSLGEALNMTRNAICKNIRKLQNYGIEIHSQKGKGYCLLEPLVLLNKKAIKKNVISKNIEFDIFETVDSTNEYLKSFFSNKTPRVCITEQMTKGKGRLNRTWQAPFGLNLYFSCLYSFNKDVSELSGLGLLVSLAIIKTLNTHYEFATPITLKWPNDLMHNHKKLSGILIELQAETNGMCHAIIGIGINVNMMFDKDNEISQPWTSLKNILNISIDRNILAAQLCNHLMIYLEKFNEQGLSAFIKEWNTHDELFNREITVKSFKNTSMGKAQGINSQGHLLLQLQDGTLHTFSAGDASIVKKISSI
jgi:BirA family biotin operon repressor/biotin-[acetyl-CoA-carboxylase] ligase